MDTLFQVLVQNSADLIYCCDANGRFTYVNPTATRVTQYSEQELLGRHFLTLIHADYQEEAAALYQRQLLEETPTTYFELPTVTKLGETIWVGQFVQLVYESGCVAGVHAIARDITRQKDTENRLRKSEARYRSLIQDASYGIYRTTVKGEILDANPAFASMLGYTVDELLAVNMSAIYKSAIDRGALIEQYRREHNQTLTTDVTWQRKDGAPIIVRLTARVADFGDGVSCFEGVAEDITEMRELDQQLRQAQKMEAVGRLARGVAHDFNNVLAAISGCSDLLLMQLPQEDPAREEAEEIRKAADRGAALTRQLLSFSRSQILETTVLDLNEVVLRLESMLQRLAGDRVALIVGVSSVPAGVRIEPGQLEQVLMNLVVNARDAMPAGGTVRVRVEVIHVDRQSAVRYPELSDGTFARVAVTGDGVEPVPQPFVFEPFLTTNGASKGAGLGLSIIYGIAKQAGGTVSFFTAPNQGTTFEVLLPLAPLAPAHQQPATSPGP